MPEEDFDYGDYDLEDDKIASLVVEPADALPYADVKVQDNGTETSHDRVVSFTNPFGRTPAEAIGVARLWSKTRRFVGVGMCLATVRQYYGVPAGIPTAADSWSMSDHKRTFRDPRDVPRGVPVYWTGGSEGSGHIVISLGGGLCLSTDWKEAGKIDVARIEDITTRWGLEYKGFTWEVNGVQVWAPVPPKNKVSLANLKPGQRNSDVLELKKVLHAKGYRGFIKSSNKFGKGIQKAYAKYQTRLGYSGHDANGVPGKNSLQKLGFRVAS